MKRNIFTRIVCIVLCICMLLPAIASCGSDDSDDDTTGSSTTNSSTPANGSTDSSTPGSGSTDSSTPGSGSTDSSTPGSGSIDSSTPDSEKPDDGSSGDDTPGGDTETTYYKVNFAVALEEYASRVTLPKEKLYEEGTELQYLPTPGVKDLLFMGWFYDALMTKPVARTDKVSSDLMLYAKVVDTSEDIVAVEGVYYHTAYDVDVDYTFSVKANSKEDVELYLSIASISSAGTALVLGEDYTVTDNGNGTFKISVNYKAGKTYRASITAGYGLKFIVDGAVLNEQVTTLNVLVAKAEVANITLSGDMIYIPKEEVTMITDTGNGLVSVGTNGATINSGDTGFLAYYGKTLKSGDKIAVYEGDIPSERDFGTDNGAVKYLTITSAEGNGVYKYRVSDSKEVLFIPDIIPVSGKTNAEREAKIAAESLDFSGEVYKQLGMNEDTKIEIGDYIAFFDGPMTQGTPVEYVRITSVRRDNQYFYIKYTPVSYDDVIASMDMYHTRTETPELSDQQVKEIEKQVYNDVMNSGFIEEAADYLVNLFVSTNGLETMPNGTTVKYTPRVNTKARSSTGSGLYYEVTKCEAEPDIKIGEGVLEHFEESNGIRVELTLSFEVEFTLGEDGENKVVISAEAVFEEEILLSLNVEGGAVWETAWIFPYIADYEMNANIDIGTYTGVSIIAKVYTSNGEEKEEEEDDDSFFPDFDLDNIGKGDSYEEKAKNIGEELKKLFELNDNINEEINGEEEDDTGNDITEKYAEMMKDANESWIEIVKADIYSQSICLDQLGILYFEIDIDFVVSAQLYIMAGVEVETGVAKRYNFSVTLFERSVKTDVIDLEKAHFAFKFYCMGTAGLKIGFELELSLSLLSSDVASVGISAELGVSLGIWGYFYYSYEKEAGEEPEIQKAGAMFFEIGIYLEVKFKAHLFNIEKLTYNPTLYENLWPIYSVGTQENVFEFEDYEDRELKFVMQGTNSIVLPDYIFRMKYLDLKDGKYYSGKEDGDETPSKTFDDETESRFLIEISDDRFTYNPKTNTLSTTVDVANMGVKDAFEVKIQITYKHGALAFNQEVITREITIEVKNNADYGYIYVSLNGPATLNAEGPGGSLSYAVKHGEAFTVDMLPTYDIKDGYKFVKWIWLQNYRDVNDKLWKEGDEFVGLDSMERRTYLYLTAVWEPQEVDFTVRIYKETLGGAYVYDRTEIVTGLAGSTYNVYNLVDAGYTVRSGDYGKIELVYNGRYDIYLERATKTIRYLNVDGEGGMITTTVKSGAALVPPVVNSRLGYNFVGWADSTSRNEPCVMPETVPYAAEKTITYTALWAPVSNIEYTVKHYVQNANDDGYSLYMTEYFTASYGDSKCPYDVISNAVRNDGFSWNSDYNEVSNIELDGSTVIRVYYCRKNYSAYCSEFTADGFTYEELGIFRNGQTVDTTVFEFIPRKNGYRFAGWDANGDGAKDDTFIMPNERVQLVAVWEGVEGTEYKVIHMVKYADTDNYVQAGVTYMYGVTDAIPDAQSIYSDKYIIEGQFVANYDKAKLTTITYGRLATMYAYYDRVEYNALVKAYDPESGELVKELTVVFPYGRSIMDKFLPSLSEFDILGYNASRYASSGYIEMPDHDIEINVVYTGKKSTPFMVNHYVEREDGTFYLYKFGTHYAATGTALHNCYRSYRLTELDGKNHLNLSAEKVKEVYVTRDGNAVLNLYYVREKVKISGNVYKLDASGKEVEKLAITEWYRYGERVILDGYFDNYEFNRVVYISGGKVIVSTNPSITLDGNRSVDIYVTPKPGVPYTVTYWVENLDGTGYEVYATSKHRDFHSAVISAETHAKAFFGFTVDAEQYESIVLDADVENNLNVYYTRNEFTVKFTNSRKTDTNVSYQVKYGATVPTPPTDTAVPGYVFVKWTSYTEGQIITGDVEYRAVYELATDTPYKVNHYVMDVNGIYQLVVTDNHTGSTNSVIMAADHIHKDYSGNGYTLRDNTSIKIAPDGSTILDVYYDRESYRFSYHYYVGGKVVESIGVLVMHGAPTPDSINDYIKDYPEYELKGFSVLKDGEYVSIDAVPSTMGAENIEIRVTLEAIGPEVTIIHKVMNPDGETYTDTEETFLAIPFEELELEYHLLASAKNGFTYRIPVNNQIPDALSENVYEIYYDRITYTVQYVNNYNFETVTESYLYGASIGSAPIFSRPGYIHVGWNATIPETMPARDIAFTTEWQIRESVPVTIVHVMTSLDGNRYVEKHRQTVSYTPELMIYGSNYAINLLGGTYKNADKKIVAEDGSTEVYVYYTRNEYTVRFTYGDIVDAGEDVAFVLPYESAIEAPDFKVIGYELMGWTPEFNGTVPAENVTYTAKWTADGVNVKVNHVIEGLDGTNTVTNTENIIAEADSIINGVDYKKTFEGFTYNEADKNVTVNRDGSTVINVYYTRNSYKVTYTYGEKSGEAVEHTVKYGATLPSAPVFSVLGYTFNGWDSELATTMPASNLEYAATWKANTDTKFTVEHHYQNANDDGYTVVETETKYGITDTTENGEDYKKALAEAIFEKTESKIVNADGTTVIKIYYTRTTYTITFTYGDKTGDSVEYTLRYGQSISYNPSFIAQGYVFAGWDKEIPATMPGENVTINATWNAGDGVEYKIEHYVQNANDDKYTLDHTDNRTGVTGTMIDGSAFATMVGNGIVLKSADKEAIAADGSTVIKIYYDRANYKVTYTYGDKNGNSVEHTVRYGATLPVAPVFSVVGYTFNGWNTELASTMPASNLTYVATWKANTNTEFTVEHYYQNANDDGYAVVETETKYGTTDTTVNGADYKKVTTGFTFANADSNVEIDANGNAVVRVYYTRNTYKVTYTYGEKNGNSVEHTVKYGATLPTAPKFSVVGYTFNGWDSELATTMPASNLTYAATWKANTNTEFTVEHYYQNANDDGYTVVESETKYGTTDATVNGADYKKALTEATFEKTESKTVNADGTTVVKIYYTRTTYNLTFTYGDKTGENVTYTLRYGQSVSYNPSFAVQGYVFAGWDKEIPATMPGENVTVNATWTAGDGVEYKIEHYVQNANDDKYTLDHTDNRTGVTGALIDGSAFATMVGNGIVLKSADKEAIAADGSTVIKIYYDRASYTVTYTYGTMAGQSAVHTVRYGATLPSAPVFSVAGYTFNGWNSELATTMPASNLTYVATWKANTDTKFTVEHYYQNANDDGYTKTETEIKYGTTDTTVNGSDYKKVTTGFAFANADSNVVINANGDAVVRIYYTRNTYKVTYTYGDKNGNSVEHTVKYGATLPSAPVFSVLGYTFNGWDSELATTMPASNLEYAAAWKANTDTKFTVEHHYQNANDDGYTVVETETKYGITDTTENGEDYKKALAEAIFEKTESKIVNADGTTVIKIYYTRTTYTITFTYGDKTGDSVEYTLRYGQSVSYNPSFAVQGYVFAGWDKEIPATMPGENVTINATWTSGNVQYKIEHYVQNTNDDAYALSGTDTRSGVTGTVVDGSAFATMVGNGIVLKSADKEAIAADGSTVIKIYYDRASYTVTYTYGTMAGQSAVHTVRYGATLPSAPVFSVAGYMFNGWNSELATTMPASNLTYVATWKANTDTKFTVEHYYQNANDEGYTKIETEIKYGTTDAAVNGADYKKAIEEAIFERAENNSINAYGTTVIKLYYTRTTYTLTFKYGFVSGDQMSYTVRYGAKLPSAPVFSALGYTFNGWIDEEGLYVDELVEEMSANDIVYTALWMANEDTPFKVEQYIEQANGFGYDLVGTETHTGRTDSTVDDPYGYVIYDDGSMYIFERFSTEELIILPDGSSVLKIYYQRVRYTATFYVVNQTGNQIDGIDFVTVTFKYGQTITPPEISVADGYEFAGYDTLYDAMPEGDIEYFIVWNCIHDSIDGDDVCDKCYEPLECTDNDHNGHCDYCRVPMGEEHRYADANNDHICDICFGSFLDNCSDENKNGKCDVCDQPTLCHLTGDDHIDEDDNHWCDDCGIWLSYRCYVEVDYHYCTVCYERFYDMCTDSDNDCICDECNNPGLCVDTNGDRICEVCGNNMPCTGHVDENENAICDYCKEPTWCVDFDDMHRDDNYDHTCDNCGIWISTDCSAGNGDGRCDECYRPSFCYGDYDVYHIDEDGDHYCDNCDEWLSYVCVDEDGDWWCDICGNELMCWNHIDEDRNALCDICREETKCTENPYDAYHGDDDWNHICDYCGVRILGWCYDDDYDGYCDVCNQEFSCIHVDDDEDNYCDYCYRIVNCSHDSVYEHYCEECYQRVSDCYDDDGDLFCDECYMDVECQHNGMDGEHICMICYKFLTDCYDENGDDECDLSEYFPHSIHDRA